MGDEEESRGRYVAYKRTYKLDDLVEKDAHRDGDDLAGVRDRASALSIVPQQILNIRK